MTASAVVYPSAIARACAALDESPAFSELPDGYLRIVVRIVKKICLSRLNAPIVASRATIAAESGKSLETVHRAVRWLEERGLVHRTQVARSGLRGSSSPLVPTQKLLDALLLTPGIAGNKAEGSIRSKAGVYPQNEARSGVSRDASKSTSQPLSSSTKDNRQGGAFEEIEKVKLPRELTWLVKDQGLKATGVLALMREAKAVKQRLSDVVLATSKYLQGLRGGELFAYLRALVRKDRDYAAQAGDYLKAHKEAEERARIARKSEELVGRSYRTRDGRIFVTVECSGILTEVRNGVRSARPMHVGFLNALDEGRLVPMPGNEGR